MNPGAAGASEPGRFVEVTNDTFLTVREEGVAALVAAVLRREATVAGLSVAFLSQEAMAELNERYRGVAGPTDVLSFPAGDDGGWPEPEEIYQPAPYLGDVVVCPAVAQANAAGDRIELGEELRRLIVHGVLHLLGYDHETDEGEMRSRESLLLEELPFGAADLLHDG